MKKLKALRTSIARSAEHVLGPPILFAGIAMLLLGVVWFAAIHLIRIEREVALHKTIGSGAELVETYEAQMVRNLETINQTLRTVKYAYELNRNDTVLVELQERALLPPPLFFTVSIIDANGMVIASTRQNELATVIEPSLLQANHGGDSDIPVIGLPAQNAAKGEWRLRFSRRLNAKNGGFGGIVMVSVEPAYFTSGYDRARFGNEGMLGMFGEDGKFLVMRTGDKVSWGESADTMARAAAEDGETANGEVRKSAWDGVRRFTHIRHIHGFPLSVAVGLSEKEQLAAFEQVEHDYVWKAVAASVLLLAVMTIMAFLSWQLTNSRRRARKVQETYYAASDASLDAFFVLRSVRDADEEIVDFILDDTNHSGAALLGAPKSRLIGESFCDFFPDFHENGILDEFKRVAQEKAVEEKDWENRNPQLQATWLQRQLVAVEGGVVAIVRDISERKRAESLRTEQAKVLEMIATGTPLDEVLLSLLHLVSSQLPGVMGAIMLLDKDGIHLSVGAAVDLPVEYLQKLKGVAIGPRAGSCGTAIYRREPVIVSDIGQDPLWEQYREPALQHGLRACWSVPILSHGDRALGSFALYYRMPHQPTLIEKQLVSIATRIGGIAIERKQAEDRIRHMAHHDPLTGLPNRSLLEDRVRQAMLFAQRHRRQMSVVFIDLDNFKLINDSLGHNAGDELLKTVAQRMVQSVRKTDTVMRLGGDEFVIVLLDQMESEGAVTLPLKKLHETIAQPLKLGGKEVQVTCSMGLATYPADGADPDTLLMNADAAMYRAKELGRNNYQFYTAEMNDRIQERLALQEGLRNAITRGELFLLYQPQVDLQSGRIIGMEALIRWQQPDLGMISPVKFIPVAEEAGIIVQIGDWVLQTACRQNKAWQEAGMPPCIVSVNVSARQFKEGDLTRRVAHALQESGLEPQYLELELTESLIMQDLQQAVATMGELQAMGVQLSIDDFGTGYSSLSALKSFPIARLKLDRSFVRDLPHDEDDRAIAMAVISLGHQLKLKVVAEGIETDEQLAFLRDNGCDEMQGYHFSRPVLPEQIAALLQKQLDGTMENETSAG